MSRIKFSLIVLATMAISMAFASWPSQKYNLKLWYRQPANASIPDNPNGWKDDPEWLKALPLGNGSLGLMVFGDINHERIQLNEESMWSGSPDDNNNPEAFASQSKIRQLLFDGKFKEAQKLTNATQICKGAGFGHGNGAQVPFGCFQTLGDLWIDNGKQAAFENYIAEKYFPKLIWTASSVSDGCQFWHYCRNCRDVDSEPQRDNLFVAGTARRVAHR
ncbi:MAG: glycoside hydrolase N-terminal domain-containing protein [Prolixibacteraceae bacterium]|nr:glycoside hydrolase N-terminal domain-containing protein [Prolixibacteraceae bacterium]